MNVRLCLFFIFCLGFSSLISQQEDYKDSVLSHIDFIQIDSNNYNILLNNTIIGSIYKPDIISGSLIKFNNTTVQLKDDFRTFAETKNRYNSEDILIEENTRFDSSGNIEYISLKLLDYNTTHIDIPDSIMKKYNDDYYKVDSIEKYEIYTTEHIKYREGYFTLDVYDLFVKDTVKKLIHSFAEPYKYHITITYNSDKKIDNANIRVEYEPLKNIDITNHDKILKIISMKNDYWQLRKFIEKEFENTN